MKNSRHAKILEIITEYNIETQDELINKLCEGGYDVTQATVSRDIKQLQLVKIATEDGKYKYALPRRDDVTSGAKFKSILRDTATSIQNAENIVVIKTYPGMANAAAAAVDALAGDSIIGCIAGDDTIFIVVKNDDEAERVTNNLRAVISVA
ncbi:MAG: arginine repressor [Clostridia bacterium]|nr:arginine repressor [Clostridia bacterium]MBQ8862444.1 arginine repressor [Clostridia bacterium]